MSTKSPEYVDGLELSANTVSAGYLVKFLEVGVAVVILNFFWGDRLLIKTSDVMRLEASGLKYVWFIFMWALLFAIVEKPRYYLESKSTLLGRAIWLSMNAGIWEELIYRWLTFFSAMVLLPFFDYLMGGFAFGHGIIHWLYTAIFLPVANWATFGSLSPQLLASNWILGAAVISATSDFCEAHKYLGILGYINSWFLGMVFFWLMFHYGIFTAMLAHALYDLILFGGRALKADEHNFRLRF